MLEYYPIINFQDTNIIDITKMFTITDLARKHHKQIYFKYLIKPIWKSPENIAYDFYGKCDYVWLVYIANNITNPFTDWLMKDEELVEYANKLFGEDHVEDIHHYEKDNIVLQKPEVGAIPVTNFQYITDLNEKRRTINLIYPELVQQIEEEIKSKMYSV